MEMTIDQIAFQVQGRIQGDGQKCITGVAPFETAAGCEITYAGSPKFLKRLHDTQAGAILVPFGYEGEDVRVIRVKNPQSAFSQVVRIFYPPSPAWTGISMVAHMGQNVQMGTDIAIGPFVVVQDHVTLGDRVTLHPHVVLGEHVVIGSDVEIFPNVTILNGTRIGNRVTIHAGTVIGGDGFGYTPDEGIYHKIPHLGIVQIDDDVEIGAGNTIDRATYGKTWIQKGVKTDNIVHIAHNVTVGENTLLVAQVGISGSTTIGRQCILAGQAGVSGHITIGDRVTIGPQSGIAGSVPDGVTVSGSPEMPHKLWLRVQRIIPRLPEIKKKIGEMEKRLNEIETTLNNTET
ncbi:MAG: UDP-3-O-(3-hydroxymyristoyl)glucosamine N-acyltransferase [Desulfatirhabdiaceae bacterium]|jgi:UDP-3-O-[3-hydroxymyristoyl] glucosamine N-acyltransferase|nr:UDP-3-O-(3-hydroxymyristoyl)glucosamine N-acyltransferase [Desulfatirhabdiaceae bacterium]